MEKDWENNKGKIWLTEYRIRGEANETDRTPTVWWNDWVKSGIFHRWFLAIFFLLLLLRSSLEKAWIYTMGKSPALHPPKYPNTLYETDDCNLTALWFHGFSRWNPSTHCILPPPQPPPPLHPSPAFPGNFRTPPPGPASWSMP